MATETNIYEISKQMLTERQVYNYDIETEMFKIEPSSQITIFPNGDLYFLANVFSDEPVDGKISSQDAALRLNAKTLNSKIHKHKMFAKPMNIENYNPNEDIMIEFLRITPF